MRDAPPAPSGADALPCPASPADELSPWMETAVPSAETPRTVPCAPICTTCGAAHGACDCTETVTVTAGDPRVLLAALAWVLDADEEDAIDMDPDHHLALITLHNALLDAGVGEG